MKDKELIEKLKAVEPVDTTLDEYINQAGVQLNITSNAVRAAGASVKTMSTVVRVYMEDGMEALEDVTQAITQLGKMRKGEKLDKPLTPKQLVAQAEKGREQAVRNFEKVVDVTEIS